MNLNEPPIQVPMENFFKPRDRYINIRSGNMATVKKALNGMVIVDYDDGKKNVEYGIEYFDRVFNPIIDVELPNDPS